MEIIKIPSSEAEVTPEWLSTILGYPIDPTNFFTTPNAHEGKGYLSNLIRIQCQKLDKTPINLMVKLVPESMYRELVTGQGLNKIEVAAYKEILPRLVTHFPDLEAYLCPFQYGQADDSTEETLLILEDLKPLGYYCLDYGQELTSTQFHEGINFLAQLHFAGCVLEGVEDKPLNVIYPLLLTDYTNTIPIFLPFFQAGFSELMTLMTNSRREVVNALASLENLLEDILHEMFLRQSDTPCISHSDLWSSNILFNSDSKYHTKVIDWQLLGYRDPTYDIATYALSCLPMSQLNSEGIRNVTETYYNLFLKFCTERNLPELQCRNWTQFLNFFNTFGLEFTFFWLTASFPSLQGKNDQKYILTFELLYDLGVIGFLSQVLNRKR